MTKKAKHKPLTRQAKEYLRSLNLYEACFILQNKKLGERDQVFRHFSPSIQEQLRKYCLCSNSAGLRFKSGFKLEALKNDGNVDM